MRRTHQRGGILVIVIVLLAMLTAILSIAMSHAGTDVKAVTQRLDRQRAGIEAESAFQYAVAQLQTQTTGPVLQSQDWYTTGQNGDENFVLGQGSFRFQILDAASLINVNTVPDLMLQNMQLTDEQRESLLDWREAGASPRTNGAKDEFYNNLTTPYNTKERRLSSVDELLLVKGWDAATLYQLPDQTTGSSTTTTSTDVPLYGVLTSDSYSSNNTATGTAKTNLSSATQQQLTQAQIPPNIATGIINARTQAGGQFTSWSQVLNIAGMNTNTAGQLLDGFQIGGAPRSEGKINLNTASEQVLNYVPSLTPDIVSAIISRQSTGFQNLSEIFQVAGMSLQIAAATADNWTVTSEIFLVRAEGTYGSSTVSKEAVISLNGNRARIIKVYDAPLSDMKTMWNWNQDTTTETTLGATE